MLSVLSLLETRVLGVLAEKERTVPDTYPLTLNALVAELPRQAGWRENRWVHLLSGPPAAQEVAPRASMPGVEEGGVAASEIAAMKTNVARLQAEVSELKALVAKVCSELGIPG